jgi:hypothetical protein
MKPKNNGKTQEKAIMGSSKWSIYWCKQESQIMPVSAACLKIVARGEARAVRDSVFSERLCREDHHYKSDSKSNILTSFSLSADSLRLWVNWLVSALLFLPEHDPWLSREL